MTMRSFVRWFLPGSLVAALLLLLPARASAVSFTTTELAPNGIEPVAGATVTADCSGCAVFQTHPPTLEEIGTHGEWSIPGTAPTVTFHFAFCETGTACTGTIPGIGAINATNTNFLTDLTPAGLDLAALVPNPIDSTGATHAGFWATVSVTGYTLIDQEVGELPGGGNLFGVRNLSDFLTLNFGPHAGANNISLDGQFNSDSDVPEPASLVLLGTGLIGAGLGYRRRRKSA